MPFPYTLNEAERFLLKVTAQEYVWAITALETGVLMGAAGLKPIENTAQFHIGYWLGRPFWGQGHATEAVRCILDYAERTFGPGCVLAEVYVDNTASRRLLEKVGFRATGRSEGYSRARGSPVTKIDMVLDRQASPSR
jgi:RimJ/RimL family protein N-acetyltransferase